MILLAAGWLALALQDPPVVTLERKAPVAELLAEIGKQTGTRLRAHENVDAKPVQVHLKEAGFFQALDAVCRAHGSVTYLDDRFSAPDGSLEIRPGDWLEFPAVYPKPFRLVVSELTRIQQRAAEGESAWSRVHLVLLAPPWLNVNDPPGADPKVVLAEAVDADGRDVLLPEKSSEPVERVMVLRHPNLANYGGGNSSLIAVRLRAFDPARGLKVLRGTFIANVAEPEDLVLVPRQGERVETSAGTWTVGRVSEHGKTEAGLRWRVPITLAPRAAAPSLRAIVVNYLMWDGKAWKDFYSLPASGTTFEVELGPAPQLPEKVRFCLRKNLRPLDIPFEFRNLVVGKKE